MVYSLQLCVLLRFIFHFGIVLNVDECNKKNVFHFCVIIVTHGFDPIYANERI